MALSAAGGRQGRVAVFERHITKWLQRAQEGHRRGNNALGGSDSEPDILIDYENRRSG